MIDEEGYYFKLAEGSLFKEAMALHYQRYQEVGFIKGNEDDPYVDSSKYFVVQTADTQEVVGVTRLIFNSLEELPTIRYFDIFEEQMNKLALLDSGKYAEVSAFTKMPKHDVGLGLIRTIFNYSMETELSHWVCCVDERVYRYLNRIFKFPFEVIGEPTVYLGSKSIPCMLDLSECLMALKEKRKPLYDYLMESENNTIGEEV